ncbi:MAG: 2-oxoacid:acceptor oxidoreductase family protein [Actinomycetota bacterium]
MYEVRIHGRGGQGVVTAAELLSVAAFLDGKHAQAFPHFGSERMGAPVVAYCRIDDAEIRTHEPVAQPDALIIQDATLLASRDVLFAGLHPDGWVVVNSTHGAADLGLGAYVRTDRLVTVPATRLALDYVGRPVPNAVMLGALAALTGRVSVDSVVDAIRMRFGGDLGARNAAAASAAFTAVDSGREALTAVRTGRKEPAHA